VASNAGTASPTTSHAESPLTPKITTPTEPVAQGVNPPAGLMSPLTGPRLSPLASRMTPIEPTSTVSPNTKLQCKYQRLMREIEDQPVRPAYGH
jgi:hypothetical protein